MENYISENINILVKHIKCSQNEFGAIFDLNVGAINSYVSKKAVPKLETILKICQYFNLTIDEFITTDLTENDKYSNKNKTSTGSKKNTYQVGDNNNNKSNNNNTSNLEDNWKQKFEFLERENALLRELLAEYRKNKE
jgi:transcriptional regulator with XRE-family HTH domain